MARMDSAASNITSGGLLSCWGVANQSESTSSPGAEGHVAVVTTEPRLRPGPSLRSPWQSCAAKIMSTAPYRSGAMRHYILRLRSR